MADYYIDSLSGLDDGDGKSPASPLPSHTGLSLSAGDTVYFRRGSEYRCGIFRLKKLLRRMALGGNGEKYLSTAHRASKRTGKRHFRLRAQLRNARVEQK